MKISKIPSTVNIKQTSTMSAQTLYGLYHYVDLGNSKSTQCVSSLCAISYTPAIFEQMKYDLTHKEEYVSFGYDVGEFVVKAVIAYNLYTKYVVGKQYGNATKQYDLRPIDLNCINTNTITFYGANIASPIENNNDKQIVIFDAIVFGNKDLIDEKIKVQDDDEEFNHYFNISSSPLELDTIYPEGVVNA